MTKSVGSKVCVDCLAMDEPPKIPRPIHDPKPRTPRCYSHFLAKRNAGRKRAKVNRQQKVYGLSEEAHTDLSSWQGGTCVCGRRHTATDHDHQIAREFCDHPEDQGCRRCLRGLLCYGCNTDILGHGYTVEMLLALIAYVRDPPAQSLFLLDDLSTEE